MTKLDTATVRDVFVGTGGDESYRLFNEWLKGEMFKAWDTGWETGNDYYGEMERGSPSNALANYSQESNPYREGTP